MGEVSAEEVGLCLFQRAVSRDGQGKLVSA